MPPTWYVTFEVEKSGKLPRRRSPRATQTFATEAEAKTFARSKLNEGLVVFAGTLNPHSPKKVVSTHDIQGWVSAGEQGQASPGNRDPK